MFTHCQILFQILLVDPPKGAQKIASGSPQPLDRVGMHFPHAIAVVISCPFLLAVTDREVGAVDPVVTLPFIGVASSHLLRIAMPMLPQRLAVGMLADSQTTLAALPTNSPDHGRPLSCIRAVPALLVGPPPRRIVRIRVLFAFFPPRAETSRRFPCHGQARWSDSSSYTHCLGGACASGARSDGTRLTPPPRRSRIPLYQCLATTTRLAGLRDCSPRRWCRCRDCRPAGSPGSDNLRTLACGGESGARAGSWPHSPGILDPGDENTSLPTSGFLVRPITRLAGKSLSNLNTHQRVT